VSVLYAYICTKSTADPFIPPQTTSVQSLSRDVSDAFYALAGGRTNVGQIAFYSQQRSVANHLLCDGREVRKDSFPELYGFLGDGEGTAADPDYFLLPNFLTTIAPATVAEPESTDTGTVSTPTPTVPPPGEYPDRSDPIYGDVDSGGRVRRESL
jgi:hypothetical protein